MPGSLILHQENDIIQVFKLDYIGIPDVVRGRSGVSSTGAVLYT